MFRSQNFQKMVYCRNAFSFIREVGYTGLFSMEFLRDKYGNDYFMEINFRMMGMLFLLQRLELISLIFGMHTILVLIITKKCKKIFVQFM